MQTYDSHNESSSPNKKSRSGNYNKKPLYKAKGSKPQYQPRKQTFNTFNEDSTTSSPSNNKNSSAVVLSSEGSDKKLNF